MTTNNGVALLFYADGYKFPDVYHGAGWEMGEERSGMRAF